MPEKRDVRDNKPDLTICREKPDLIVQRAVEITEDITPCRYRFVDVDRERVALDAAWVGELPPDADWRRTTTKKRLMNEIGRSRGNNFKWIVVKLVENAAEANVVAPAVAARVGDDHAGNAVLHRGI